MAKGKSIAKRAEEVGAKGRRLSSAKQALRDTLIVTRKAQDWPIAAIATEAGVSVRTVHTVLREREQMGQDLLARDPIDVVKTMATQLQGSIGDFEAMAYAYGETHPSAAVGAKKGADQAREKLLMLLQATGRMPRDLGGLGDLMGMRELASEMVDAVRAFKRGEADADHVEETFTRALGLGRPRPELTQKAT
jgi:AcrR family transcriptional regulator